MKNEKTQKMKEMVEMMDMYYALPKERQAYISGLIAGLAVELETNSKENKYNYGSF